MMRWFGEPWPSEQLRAPVCQLDELRVATPVGERCLFCPAVIGPDDQGVLLPYVGMADVSTLEPVHIDCLRKDVLGTELAMAPPEG
jgi:hypothetical protein